MDALMGARGRGLSAEAARARFGQAQQPVGQPYHQQHHRAAEDEQVPGLGEAQPLGQQHPDRGAEQRPKKSTRSPTTTIRYIMIDCPTVE